MGHLSQIIYFVFSGDTWYMDEPEALSNLIKIGLDNLNMFQNPIFLHDQSLLNLEGPMLAGFKVGQTLGELELGGCISI